MLYLYLCQTATASIDGARHAASCSDCATHLTRNFSLRSGAARVEKKDTTSLSEENNAFFFAVSHTGFRHRKEVYIFQLYSSKREKRQIQHLRQHRPHGVFISIPIISHTAVSLRLPALSCFLYHVPLQPLRAAPRFGRRHSIDYTRKGRFHLHPHPTAFATVV